VVDFQKGERYVKIKCATDPLTILHNQFDDSEIGISLKNEDMPGFKTTEATVRTILFISR